MIKILIIGSDFTGSSLAHLTEGHDTPFAIIDDLTDSTIKALDQLAEGTNRLNQISQTMIEELQTIDLKDLIRYEEEERFSPRSGWYEPRKIGKPLGFIKRIPPRIRTKTFESCRYNWKLKKSKKIK